MTRIHCTCSPHPVQATRATKRRPPQFLGDRPGKAIAVNLCVGCGRAWRAAWKHGPNAARAR